MTDFRKDCARYRRQKGIGAAIVRRLAADGAAVKFPYAGSAEASATLAAETGSNAVQPGPTDTDTNPGEGPMGELMHSLAIKRRALFDEVAGMVTYRVGAEAGIVMGALYTIDGGFGA